MAAESSWWLKFKRAQHHMVELERCARAYARSHPYSVVRISEPERKATRQLRYKLVMESPDPMVAMILGDFVHNLRSALDHVVVACSTPGHRNKASFPVAYEDLFAKDPLTGTFVHPDNERRRSFQQSIAGLKGTAGPIAIIMAAQPYNGTNPNSHVIGVLSRLENADKHRGLIALGEGLRAAELSVYSRGRPQIYHSVGWRDFFFADAQIVSFAIGNPDVTESDVEVRANGTASIHIKVTGVDRNGPPIDFNLRQVVLRALHDVRILLRALEPYAIRA